jgi:hypothetical protein
MSLRFLYRKVPVTQRTCSYYRCQKPILRNIARDQNGKLYHYGCLGSARDERYRCLECYSMFDATEASFQSRQRIQGDSIGEIIRLACPNCGCINLKPLNARNPS